MFDATLALKLTDALIGWLDRSKRSEAAPPPKRNASRIANPRLAPATAGNLFVLRATPTCEITAWLDGRRFSRETAVPLPMPGCNRMGCACHYEPIAERRRASRRTRDDRREALRFEQRSDRRERSGDRRGRGAWERDVAR